MTRIRRVEMADREPVLDLLKSTAAFQDHELAVALELIDISLRQPEQQDYHPYVLEENGSVEAYVCFGKNPMTRSTFDLYWLATRRSSMRRGYGRALVSFSESEIRRMGGKLVVIETSSKEAYQGSREFYQRLGYELVATLPDFYDVGDDRVIYCRRL